MDEADTLFNASPFARVRCEYGYMQSNAGVFIDVSKRDLLVFPRTSSRYPVRTLRENLGRW